MEQLQFNDNFAGEGFDPVTQIDYTKSLDRRNARLNKADEEALAQVRRNSDIRIQNAQDSGKGLEALGKLSGKLSKLLGTVAKERKEEQDAEDVAFGFELWLKNGLDMSGFKETMGQAKDQAHTAANVEAGVLDEDGNNYEASSAIGKSTAFNNANQAKGFVMGAMGEYGTFMEQAVNPSDYTDSVSHKSARREAMKEFMKRAGLSGLKPQFLASTIYPKIAETEARAASDWSIQHRIKDSAIRRQEAYTVFQADNDVAVFLDAIRNTVDANGKPIGFAGAWSVFDTRVIEMRKAGLLSYSDVEQMQAQPIPGDPKGRTYGELYKAKFINIEKQVAAQERTDWTNQQADNKMEFEQAEQQIFDSLIDGADTDGYTDSQIDEFNEALFERFRIRSSKLDNLKQTSVDADMREDQEVMIQNLIKMNLLTPERLSKFDPKHQQTYLSTAQEIAKAAKDNDNYGVPLESIKRLVELEAKITPDGRHHQTTGLKVDEMQKKFRYYLGQYALSSPETAAQDALNQVTADFQKEKAEYTSNGSTFFDAEKGFPGMIGKTTGKEEMKRRVEAVNYALQNKTIDDRGVLTLSEVQAASKGYGEPGYSTPPIVDYIAEKLGVDPLTVLNKQLEAAGMEPLPPSPATEVIQNQLSPTQQKLLYQFKTPERSARGLIGQTQYNPEIVPGGYGQTIQDAASKHNIDPGLLAGLLEAESGYRPEVIKGIIKSKSGATGIAQIMPGTASDYNVDPTDSTASIYFAAKYLRDIMDGRGTEYNRQVDLNTAIYMYNAGPNYKDLATYPLPGENEAYLGRVLTAAGKYGYGKQALTDPGTMRPSIAQNYE